MGHPLYVARPQGGPVQVGCALFVFVDILDEAGQFERRRANGANRLVVVHPERAKEGD